MIDLPWLDPDSTGFPDTSHALDEPNGLLAAGGDLRPERLLSAYQQGIFPWFEDSQPILWWTPSPRLVLPPSQLHVSKSLRKFIRKGTFTITSDQAFREVMIKCSEPRGDEVEGLSDGTWITDSMLEAYCSLHRLGYAHSIEVWQQEQLVGGLYGIALGKVFFGESMFSRADNASKVAFVALV
jgi:leucyl/phenylalanyl-tRNA--protein transferase